MHSESAWLAFGVRIPKMSDDQLEEALTGFNNSGDQEDDRIGFLNVGRYDDEDTYLVTWSKNANVGTPVAVRPQDVTPQRYARWNVTLRRAIETVGVTELSQPGWLLIADAS